MGTGANYTEFQPGKFAIDVNQILPINITNISGQCLCVSDSSLIAKEIVTVQNFPQVAANTNIFFSDLNPIITPVDFRVQIIMSNSGVFSVVITNGGNSQVGSLNGGVALTAGALYIFDILINKGDTINFRYSNTGGNIQVLRVQELDAGTY